MSSLIDITPKVIGLEPIKSNQVLGSQITIKNQSKNRIAIKIKSTNPTEYKVKPNQTILEIEDQQNIEIIRKLPQNQVNEKFLILAAVIPDPEMELSEVFKQTPSSQLDQYKLKVVVSGLNTSQKLENIGDFNSSQFKDSEYKSIYNKSQGQSSALAPEQNVEATQNESIQMQQGSLSDADYQKKLKVQQEEYDKIMETLEKLQKEKLEMSNSNQQLKQQVQKQRELKLKKMKSKQSISLVKLVIVIVVGVFLGYSMIGSSDTPAAITQQQQQNQKPQQEEHLEQQQQQQQQELKQQDL